MKRKTKTKTQAKTFLLLISLMLSSSVAYGVTPPRVLDPLWKIELIASEPELVTPTGCRFDRSGRLYVVECHTHFPPDNYDGPQADRIHIFDDANGDGILDRQRLFYEGGEATMGIAPLPDGWLAVATRSELFRIRDSDADNTADQRESLLKLKTKATYPHNGLAGLALGPDGWLYVGQGENLGEPFELLAADASKQTGGGEGGNIYRCTTEGNRLERIATGFWNPFGICFDPAGRLWTVGNDPDAMPPCRLIHVLPCGDYGFQFRFRRAGTHPLQSWNGEFPGTLPMVAGTGEAPGDVIGHDGRLWVTSWGDNRIERYKLSPKGASWSSETEVVVQGGADFRPVAMAVAPDGSLYVTDWVDRSYPVHGKGRLWRISRASDAPRDANQLPPQTPEEKEALTLLQPSTTLSRRLQALADSDPAVRQFAIAGLVQSDQIQSLDRAKAESPSQRVGLLAAWRWKELTESEGLPREVASEWIDWGFNNESEEVVLAALRWATERRRKDKLKSIGKLLDRKDLTPRLFSAVVAATAYLETGSAAAGRRDPAREKLLADVAGKLDLSANVRALAIQMLDPQAESPTSQQLGQWLDQERDRQFSIAVIRLLSARGEEALAQLAKIAADDSQELPTRADAIAALARSAGKYAVVLNKLSTPRQPDVLRNEARRATRRTWRDDQPRPTNDDLKAWDELVGRGGDRDAGRRVFFRTTCANCHAHAGRGASTGPDLTELSGQMSSLRLIESILHPSKEIGPLYVPWRVITVDGRVLTGLKLGESGAGKNIKFQGADGLIFEVPLADIERQDSVKQSIMPAGLADSLSIDEIRDLVAFLVGKK